MCPVTANINTGAEHRVLRKIANLAVAVMLTATLLWGGCLSCAQYFMFPGGVEKSCCMPSGDCKKTQNSPAPQRECRIQPMALKAAPPQLLHASILENSSFVLPPQATVLTIAATFPHTYRNTRSTNLPAPPDLCLLHSVFRI